MKAVRSTTLTGGADGPTSVFIVGKKDHKKHIFQRIKNRCRQRRYRHKRQKAERMIKPGAHSLSETVRYMKNDFDAKEADSSYPHYEERRLQMKCSLLRPVRDGASSGVRAACAGCPRLPLRRKRISGAREGLRECRRLLPRADRFCKGGRT